MSYSPQPLPPRAPLSDEDALREARDFLASLETRASVRDFSDRPVPYEIIETCIRAAGTAPSGANQQPWHFAAISDPALKSRIREAAEEEERAFYAGGGGDAWLAALEPIGTDASKPHLTTAPWLIVIFAQRYGTAPDGSRAKHYYVPESVGIATGMLMAACHQAGLATLVHTPNPMKFLNRICGRPETEKPFLILVAGYPADGAMVPKHALVKKPLDQIMEVL